jgi:hypothetical protein
MFSKYTSSFHRLKATELYTNPNPVGCRGVSFFRQVVRYAQAVKLVDLCIRISLFRYPKCWRTSSRVSGGSRGKVDVMPRESDQATRGDSDPALLTISKARSLMIRLAPFATLYIC